MENNVPTHLSEISLKSVSFLKISLTSQEPFEVALSEHFILYTNPANRIDFTFVRSSTFGTYYLYTKILNVIPTKPSNLYLYVRLIYIIKDYYR